MAFVYRSERKIRITDKEMNNAYPGEYYKEIELIKDIDKQNYEFKSESKRLLSQENISKFITPGPGAYEKNVVYYDDTYKKILKPKEEKQEDIYDQLKNGLMSKEIIKFLKKNDNVAFNTRSPRFNYSVENLEKQKKLPGPGSYSPNSNFYIKKKEKTFLLNNSSTNLNSSTNNGSKITKINLDFNSDYRTETIPSKGNVGYDIDKDGNKKLILNPSKEKISDKKEEIGPGKYDIIESWDKNIINWSKTKNDQDPKYEIIKTQKNLIPITQLEQDYIDNIKKNTKSTLSTKYSKTTENIKNKNPVFNFILNLRYNKTKELNQKKEKQRDFIFETTPGPGYYSPDSNCPEEKYLTKNSLGVSCFESKSPRFTKTSSINKTNNNLGPGYYYNKTKPLTIKKPNYIKGLSMLENRNCKNYKNSALKISLEKEDFKIPGPGAYELQGNLLHDEISNNKNFGRNGKRFIYDDENENNNLGPGCYDPYKKEEFPISKDSFHNKNLFTNFKSNLKYVEEAKKIPKEKYEVPPVGLYNPNIVTSVEYETQSKINPFVDGNLVGFGAQAKKSFDFVKKDDNKFLGPGLYNKEKPSIYKQNAAPFNEKNKRFNYTDENLVPGPGAYNINSYDDWNKKSHNILFV